MVIIKFGKIDSQLDKILRRILCKLGSECHSFDGNMQQVYSNGIIQSLQKYNAIFHQPELYTSALSLLLYVLSTL